MLTDLHIDIKRPMKSVAFMEQKTDQSVTVVPCEVPVDLAPLMRILISKLTEIQTAANTGNHVVEAGPLRFRATRMRTDRYALRQIVKKIRPFEDLALGTWASDMLLDPDYRNGGLILVAGAPGTGKSTTAATTLVTRLERFGGYALTVEDPVEFPLEGFHGDGFVEQIDAGANGFQREVTAAMRQFPAEIRSMFLFGEVLEGDSAAELTRLIARGHLVITTIHARDIISAIEMLVSFAEKGGERYARQLIGANLLCVVHQQLINRKPVVNAIRINETMRNIICNDATNLFMLANAIDLDKRQKFNRRATDRADTRNT